MPKAEIIKTGTIHTNLNISSVIFFYYTLNFTWHNYYLMLDWNSDSKFKNLKEVFTVATTCEYNRSVNNIHIVERTSLPEETDEEQYLAYLDEKYPDMPKGEREWHKHVLKYGQWF